MKIAVAIVHGMGSQQAGFSKDLQVGIAKHYQQLGLSWDDLIFSEVLWADLLIATQQRLMQRVNYRNDLNYLTFRQFFTTYLGDVIAFQPGCDDESQQQPMRDQIFKRVTSSLNAFLSIDGCDANSTPLVVIAHSLGSIIAFDYLWQHQRHQKPSQFECGNTLAGFMTLGSPLALWATRYQNFGNPFAFPGEQLPEPIQTQSRWLNFYDKDDVIAYPLKGLNPAYNEAVSEDIAVNIGNPLQFWNPLSHSAYWQDGDIHQAIAAFLATLSRVS